MVVITTAGDPGHWSHGVLTHAKADPLWRVHEVDGPPPWIDPERLAEQRRRLPESVYARLFENQWTAPEDSLVNPDDLAACTTLDGPLPPQAGRRYAIGVDIGITNDRTAVSVCHSERVLRDGITVGHKRVPRPSPGLARFTPGAGAPRRGRGFRRHCRHPVHPRHGRLRPVPGCPALPKDCSDGVSAPSSSPSRQANVGRLALNLHNLLRTRSLALPDDSELLSELQRVQLRETAPNLYRIDHASGEHDDRVISLSLAANYVTERYSSVRGPFSRASSGFAPAACRPLSPCPLAITVTPRLAPVEARQEASSATSSS